MRGLHGNTAEVLRMLAASPQPELFSTLTDEGIRLVLKLAAEACEHRDQVEQDRDVAAIHAANLRSLLDRVAPLLDALPPPTDGGTWEAFALAEEVRRARAAEPPPGGHRLQQERLAARRCVRAATALVVALRERDTACVRKCIQAFEEAYRAYDQSDQLPENVHTWPRGGPPVLEYLEGAF